MVAQGYTLFETSIGSCGIAWEEHGIVCVQLPEASLRATRTRLENRVGGASERVRPSFVQHAIEGIEALLRGEERQLQDVLLDMRAVPAFYRRVYEQTREIPPGKTATYGHIAAQLGEPRAARAVGQALGKNPFALVVPCHRVIAASGKLCGFSAEGGLVTKQRLLAIEGAPGFRKGPTAQVVLFGAETRAA